MTPVLRVLNLEDNADDSALLRRLLIKEGFDLTFVAVFNHADFTAALAEQEWDVILADYTVPGFDAPAALQSLKETGRDIPFIVLSGAVGEDAAVSIMRAGAADFILKDSMARLIPAIEREMQEASNRRERTRDQVAWLQSEARLRAILEHSPAAIYMKDREGRYVLANRVCADIFGAPDSEIVEKTDHDIFPESLARIFRDHDLRVIHEGKPVQFEERATGADPKVYVSVKFPVYDAFGSPLGVGGISTEITDLKQAEDALRRSEKLATAGRLAATIAHEINNPLEAVVNLLFLLSQDKSLPPSAQKLLSMADRELVRVSHIARQTLGFYRDSTRPTTFSVGEVAQEIINLYQQNCRKKMLQVVADLDNSAVLFGLRGEIVQLFSNLLTNAIDACRIDGTIRVRVRPLSRKATQHRELRGVRITVADDGVGIPESAVAQIYEPFYTTKRDVGTGLGLWVTKKIVENHKGSIRLRSQCGPERSGTLFHIALHGAAAHPRFVTAAPEHAA